MKEPLFSQDELNSFEGLHCRHRRAGSQAVVQAVKGTLAASALAAVAATEWTLFQEIFSYLKGPDLPGEAEIWSPAILALTGMVMAVGYHCHAKTNPDSFAVRAVDALARASLLPFALGAGLALASIIHVDGADVLAKSGDLGNFLGGTNAEASPIFDRVLAFAPALFSIACGCLSAVNLSLAHRLGSFIERSADDITEKFRAARKARAAIKVIRDSEKRHAALVRERDALLAIDHQAHASAAATEILGVVAENLQPVEQWLTEQQVRDGGTGRFAVPHTSLDAKEIAARVARIKALNQQSILSAMRVSAKEKAS